MTIFKKPRRKVSRVFLHCSASDNPAHDNAATMDKWHKARGWCGIGYHFFIRKSGKLESGRDINKIPAAQGGNNKGTIAICLHGLEKEKFTQPQFKTLRKLCAEINAAYDGNISFHGHCEVSNKSCPVFDYKSVLNLDVSGRFENSKTAVAKKLEMGMSSDGVKTLQSLLLKSGYRPGVPDGIFGRLTRDALLAFQADNLFETTGKITVDNAQWQRLLKKVALGERRSVSAFRAQGKPQSRIVDASEKSLGIGGLSLAALGSTGLADAGGWLDGLQGLKDKVANLGFGLDFKTLIILGMAGVIVYLLKQARDARAARIEDYREGKTI